MKGLVAATAVLGALAIGGIPVLALSLASDESSTTAESGDTANRPGPPSWANGHAYGHDKAKNTDKPKDKGEPGWARHGDEVPPGWARNHKGKTPHGWEMRRR